MCGILRFLKMGKLKSMTVNLNPATELGVPPHAELDRLSEIASDVLKRAKQKGADQAEVGVEVSVGLNINVRMKDVETLEHTRDRGLSLTVYVNQRKGSASTADLSAAAIEATLEQALAIARFTEADPCAGLAPADRMANAFHALDHWHPWLIDGQAISADQAIELALQCEAAGLDADARIRNSDGASVNTSSSYGIYANTHGFIGRDFSTSHSISASLLAGADGAMERDYWYDHKLSADDLQSAESVGRKAAERTLARLNPQSLSTRSAPILFVPELARGLIGHLLSAVGGSAQYRKSSFLLGALDTQVLPDWFAMTEYPHLARAMGSANYDDEGVATKISPLIEAGVLRHYLLGSYSARKLGMQSTANAGGVHNLVVQSNAGDFSDMTKKLHTGLIVTELMGQGVNGVTGDYSRGAAGFWVENGQIQFPVSEITIAGNLRDMYRNLVAVGSDVDMRGNVRTGSILLNEMTIAGGNDAFDE
jgi:PmbA protein